MKTYFVYILTNKKDGVLYIGFTDDLARRMFDHKNKLFEGFTKKYNVDKLVYYETFSSIEEAMIREKRLKKWNRLWKIELIEKENRNWIDLSNNFQRITSLDFLKNMYSNNS